MFSFSISSKVLPDPARAAPAATRRALVGFVGCPASSLHRLLRPGFRHCFTLIDDGDGWMLIDPLKDRIEVRQIELPAGFDLAAFYTRRGHCVLEGRVRHRHHVGAPVVELATCVTVVKRVLGIASLRVQTPHQLYRHLQLRHDPPFCRRAGEEGC